MFLKLHSLVAMGMLVLACWAAAVQGSAITKRQTGNPQDLGSLYAYGEGIDGIPVFWADRRAYIGTQPPPDTNVVTNITFQDDPDSQTLTVTPDEADNLAATTLYIDNSAGANAPAGFTSDADNGLTDGNVVTSGFRVFGNQIVFIENDGTLKQLWWAMPTDGEGVWELRWNVDVVTDGGAVPVVVKNVPPPATVANDL